MLENNANEMKTQVQTYLIEETQELIYDNEKLEHWGDLVKKLGLEGQTQIHKLEKSPIPFLCLNRVQEAILNTLCPREVEIKEYDSTPIPVDLLDLIALSVKEGYFQKIQVWYDDKQKDPAVVGLTGHWKEYSWYGDSNKELKDQKFATKQEGVDAGGKHVEFSYDKKYLLGRWADVKEDFKQLAQRAKERFIGEEKSRQEQAILTAQRELEDLNSKAFEKFGV